MSQLADEKKMWSDLRELKAEAGWDDDDLDYLARKKQVGEVCNKLYKAAKKSEKANISKVVECPSAEEKPNIVIAKWERAGTYRFAGERNYPKALGMLNKGLAAMKHALFEAGSGYPALRQGRNGNSSGKNYYTREPETGEIFQYRFTCNGEEGCAPLTPTPPPLISHA
jgi:hypothetical protein